MRERVLAMGLSLFGTIGCAGTSLPELGVGVPTRVASDGPALPELSRAPKSEPEPAPASMARGNFRGLERQLHRIADRQLDVSRTEVEALFDELRVKRLLAQTAAEAAGRKLEAQRESRQEDELRSFTEP
jgi:hypothetical protein